MPDPSAMVQGKRVKRLLITIPATGGAAATLAALAVAADSTLAAIRGQIMGAKVHVAGAAYHAGDSLTSLPIPVSATETYEEPTTDFAEATYVKSDATAISNVPLSLYLGISALNGGG